MSVNPRYSIQEIQRALAIAITSCLEKPVTMTKIQAEKLATDKALESFENSDMAFKYCKSCDKDVSVRFFIVRKEGRLNYRCRFCANKSTKKYYHEVTKKKRTQKHLKEAA